MHGGSRGRRARDAPIAAIDGTSRVPCANSVDLKGDELFVVPPRIHPRHQDLRREPGQQLGAAAPGPRTDTESRISPQGELGAASRRHVLDGTRHLLRIVPARSDRSIGYARTRRPRLTFVWLPSGCPFSDSPQRRTGLCRSPHSRPPECHPGSTGPRSRGDRGQRSRATRRNSS